MDPQAYSAQHDTGLEESAAAVNHQTLLILELFNDQILPLLVQGVGAAAGHHQEGLAPLHNAVQPAHNILQYKAAPAVVLARAVHHNTTTIGFHFLFYNDGFCCRQNIMLASSSERFYCPQPPYGGQTKCIIRVVGLQRQLMDLTVTAQIVATGKGAAAGRANKRLLAAVRGQLVLVQVAGLEEAFAARVADGAALVRMRPGNSGLAMKTHPKNPPKKTHLKTHYKWVFCFF
jgi:hypothetical protein